MGRGKKLMEIARELFEWNRFIRERNTSRDRLSMTDITLRRRRLMILAGRMEKAGIR